MGRGFRHFRTGDSKILDAPLLCDLDVPVTIQPHFSVGQEFLYACAVIRQLKDQQAFGVAPAPRRSSALSVVGRTIEGHAHLAMHQLESGVQFLLKEAKRIKKRRGCGHGLTVGRREHTMQAGVRVTSITLRGRLLDSTTTAPSRTSRPRDSICPFIMARSVSSRPSLIKPLGESTDRGFVGLIVLEREAREADERQPVEKGRFFRWIAQVVPALQQQDFEHSQRRVRGIAHGLGLGLAFELLVEEGLDWPPVDDSVDLVEKNGLGPTPAHEEIPKPRFFAASAQISFLF